MAKATDVARDETAERLVEESIRKTMKSPAPPMPTVADLNAETRHAEKIMQDPKNQTRG